jgi:hypothetical protein
VQAQLFFISKGSKDAKCEIHASLLGYPGIFLSTWIGLSFVREPERPEEPECQSPKTRTARAKVGSQSSQLGNLTALTVSHTQTAHNLEVRLDVTM